MIKYKLKILQLFKQKIRQKIRNKLITLLGIQEKLNKLDLILNSLNVGLDCHYNHDSWAVICLDGNPCYIKFFKLPKGEIKYIKDFLKQYNRKSTIVDDPLKILDRF